MDDPEISSQVVKLMKVDTEISPNWSRHYEGYIPSREELYKEEVLSTMNYLQLRKIKKLIAENQSDLEKAANQQDQLIYIQTHQHLKKIEVELTKKIGTVIFK